MRQSAAQVSPGTALPYLCVEGAGLWPKLSTAKVVDKVDVTDATDTYLSTVPVVFLEAQKP